MVDFNSSRLWRPHRSAGQLRVSCQPAPLPQSLRGVLVPDSESSLRRDDPFRRDGQKSVAHSRKPLPAPWYAALLALDAAIPARDHTIWLVLPSGTPDQRSDLRAWSRQPTNDANLPKGQFRKVTEVSARLRVSWPGARPAARQPSSCQTATGRRAWCGQSDVPSVIRHESGRRKW